MSRSERGAYGNKRGKEAQRRRRRLRESDPRYQRAMQAVHEQQAEVDRLVKEERKGAVAGAKYSMPEVKHEPVVVVKPSTKVAPKSKSKAKPKVETLPFDGEGKGDWKIRHARSMLRSGYNIRHVVHMTGVGTRWLDDITLDEDGYGMSDE